MIALDTNVLVRYLVEDDARQTAQAAALVKGVIAAGERLFVSDIVVCETVWVLSGAYRVSRKQIVTVLRDLFRARHLAFANPAQLSRSLAAFDSGKGDFADYLIREHARAFDEALVATFDRLLLREPGFINAALPFPAP